MSSATEEPAREPRSALLSLDSRGSSQLVMLEVLPDSHTARIVLSDAKLEITGDVFERFMENLTRLRLPQEKALALEVAISIPRLRHVGSVQSSSSMQGLGELSITTAIEILLA